MLEIFNSEKNIREITKKYILVVKHHYLILLNFRTKLEQSFALFRVLAL